MEKGIYKEIFNKSVSGYYVYNSVKIIREIDKILGEKINGLGKKSGRDYGLLVHGNRIISMIVVKKMGLKNSINEIDFSIDGPILNSTIENVIAEIKKILETHYPDNILGTLFKNVSKCNNIVDLIGL